MPARIQEIYNDRENMEFRPNEEMEIYAVPPIDPSQIRAGELAVPIKLVNGHLRSRNFISGSSGWEINYLGDAEFNNVTVRGTIVSQTGEIAGFVIDENTISKNNLLLDSTGKIVLGTGNDSIHLSSVDSTYRLWIGNTNPVSAPFSVTKAGVMKIESGLLAGWTITNSKFVSPNGNMEFDSTNNRILLKKSGSNKIVIQA